jgi:PEP-CTERM motif.
MLMLPFRAAATALLAAALSESPSAAAIIWNESLNGDLSNVQGTPTALALASGTNSIVGAVEGDTDPRDFVSLTVPVGKTLSSITLFSYGSPDPQGFTGIQAGASFVGSPFSASSYAGYAHYGTGAVNGALPPTNLVGADLLPIMANPLLAVGATGLTVPLAAGTYTFVIQQLGDAASYRFDYEVVPEPEVSSLCAAGLALLAWWRRRPRSAT